MLDEDMVMATRIDVPLLQQIVNTIRKDTSDPGSPAYRNAIMLSIMYAIEEAMSAPAMQPTFERGCEEADRRYDGSPSYRLAFNSGVKWCLDQMSEPYRMRDTTIPSADKRTTPE